MAKNEVGAMVPTRGHLRKRGGLWPDGAWSVLLSILVLGAVAGPLCSAATRAVPASFSLSSDAIVVVVDAAGDLHSVALKGTETATTDLGAVGNWSDAAGTFSPAGSPPEVSLSRYAVRLSGTKVIRLTYTLSGSILRAEMASLDGSPLSGVRFEMPLTVPNLQAESRFKALASYYNGTRPIRLNEKSGAEGLEIPYAIDKQAKGEWLGSRSRYLAYLASAPGATATLSERVLVFEWKEPTTRIHFQLFLGDPKLRSSELSGAVGQLRYLHTVWGLRHLCLGLESLLLTLHALVGSWGLAIVLLSLLFRVLVIPINRRVSKYQSQVDEHQAILEAKTAEIRQQYDGQAAHERIMAEYKALGISPFHTLKPMLGLLVQIPWLIAVFNILGELEAIRGNGFLWIRDLSYPDAVCTLPVLLPFFGDSVNVLPFVMTMVNVVAGITHKADKLPASLQRRQRRNMYLMAGGFFAVFYPFPASMVLYWTTSNAVQLLQQILGRSRDSSG